VSTDQLAALDRVVLTYSKMIDSEPIASTVLDDLSLEMDVDDVVAATNVEPEPATQLLYIEVTDEEPSTAQALANARADTFVEVIPEFSEIDAEDSTRLPARVFERAALPTEADPSERLRTMILAGVFGLVAGAALAFLLDYLDVSLRNASDVERKLELPVLGVIPAFGAEAPFGRRVAAPDSERRAGRTPARDRERDRDRGRDLERERG
jgi:capsular polysaccharide biosynthesis protein